MSEGRGGDPPERAHPRSPLQRVVDPLRLELVLEVGRHGSITRAADACGISQPMASAHLRTLEVATGQSLFERDGRGTRLTDAGRVVAEHAAVILATLARLQEELSTLGGAQAGTLRLAACGDFGNYVLPRVLSAFAAERPRVELQVAIAPSGDVVRAVAAGRADIGIAGEVRGLDAVRAERLLQDELIGIAPRDLPMTSPLVLHERTLVVSARASSTRAHTDRLLAPIGRPGRTCELDSVEAVKRAVAAGVGIAFVSVLAAGDDLEHGRLRAFGIRGAGPLERWLYVVRRQHGTPSPVAQAFERTLRAFCDRHMRTADGGHREVDLPLPQWG